MSQLSGIRILKTGNDRLFDPLSKALIIIDGLSIAIMAVHSGGHFEFRGAPHTTAMCGSFPLIVKFPLLLPMIHVVDGNPMTEIAFSFEPKPPPQPLPPGKKQNTVSNYAHTVLHAITPVYVDFYEKHRGWLRATYKDDTTKWPAFFNFIRMVRNFISHHSGHVHFDNPRAAPVTWHHLTYGPKDEGKNVIGTDIQLGDLIILLFEFGDALDHAGCPLAP